MTDSASKSKTRKSSNRHPKFEWIDAVSADRRLGGTQRLVLTYCARKYVSSGQTTFSVRQETIAQRCGCGIATVKRTFARARDIGYLATVRSPRGRNLHRGDEHRLTYPNDLGINSTDLGINLIPGNPADLGIILEGSRDHFEPIQGSSSADLGIICDKNIASDQQECSPLGSLKEGSLKEGSLKGSLDARVRAREAVPASKAEPKPSTRRGTRLPDGWEPPENVIRDMHAQFPQINLRAEHAKFCDYWQAKPGKDAEKLDWAKTWRNWIRGAAERTPNGHRNGHTLSTSDRIFADIQAMKSGNQLPRLELP